MSSIIYYSNSCDRCKSVLSALSKSQVSNDIHFLCIDRRVKSSTGAVHIITDSGEKVLLPPQVNRVPALLLLNKGHLVLYGDQILQHFQPKNVALNDQATGFNGEPNAFALGRESMGSGFGVASDNYSFLDQSADELSAKGNGGMRQLYNYATIDLVDKIETPPDTYSPDKVGSVSMEQLQQKRQSEIQNQQQQNTVVGGGGGAMGGAMSGMGGSGGVPGSQRGQNMPPPQQYAPVGTPPQFAAQAAYRAPPQQPEYSRLGGGGGGGGGGGSLRGTMDIRAQPRGGGSWI
jgi:hypothetical protein